MELNLSGCRDISDVSVAAISTYLSNLRNLNLAYTNITNASAQSLAQGVCAKQLQVNKCHLSRLSFDQSLHR